MTRNKWGIPVESHNCGSYLSRLGWLTLWALAMVLIFGAILFSCRRGDEVYAREAGHSVEHIADAIYKAEGGAKTRHPYGILAKYKTTTPRQACINTIKHAQRDWNGKGDFLSFLQKRYAPIGVINDPKGLNRFWLTNVKHFLEVNKSKEVSNV